MFHKLTILSSLVLSATCMVLHQPASILLGYQYNDNPNYNFAYEVNDQHTGDVKSQHESRRGDTVLGQYSLLQPDGIQRTVDYRADDHTGFQANVNNNGEHTNQHGQANNGDIARHPNIAVQSYQAYPTQSQAYPTQSQSYSTQRQAYPTQSQAYSTQSHAYSSQNQAYPTQSQAYPTQSQAYSIQSQAYPTQSISHTAPVHTPVAVSRSSFTQTISHGPVQTHGPIQYPWP